MSAFPVPSIVPGTREIFNTLLLNGWTEGGMKGRMEGWVGGWRDGQMDRRMDPGDHGDGGILTLSQDGAHCRLPRLCHPQVRTLNSPSSPPFHLLGRLVFLP